MKKLKIRTQGMFGTSHSWAVTMRNLFAAFERAGHDLYINTTNGVEGVPKKWFKYFKDCVDPDIDICYTLPINFPHRFAPKAKCKLGIYNYESSKLPSPASNPPASKWAEYYKYVDYILPSSVYCKDIFIDAGIPADKLPILPLGIDFEHLASKQDDFKLKTDRKFKLLNVSIPHVRKNIPALVDAYLKEFSDADDICLVIKSSSVPASEMAQYEIDVVKAITQLIDKNAKEAPGKILPQIELVDYKFNNIATIYNQCDALINVASSEGFGLPLLEAMACGKLVAAPNFGGVKDFLNTNNSLLMETVEIIASPLYQYWHATEGAVVGFPVADSIRATMRELYENHEELHKRFDENMKETVKQYTWDNSAKIVTDLANNYKPVIKLGELI